MITHVDTKQRFSHTEITVSRDDGADVRIGIWRGCLSGADSGFHVATEARRQGSTWTVRAYFGGNVPSPAPDGWWKWRNVRTEIANHDKSVAQHSVREWREAKAWADREVVPGMRAVFEEVMTAQVAASARKYALLKLTDTLAQEINRERQKLDADTERLIKWCRELSGTEGNW